MNSGDYSGVYVAKLLHDVNKYKPGSADFSIPAIMDNSGIMQTQKINNSNSNIANQDKKNIGISTATITKSIKIAIPLELVYFFPTKIIPTGTIFFVSFVGSDINKPIIVGRDINGYIATTTNSIG